MLTKLILCLLLLPLLAACGSPPPTPTVEPEPVLAKEEAVVILKNWLASQLVELESITVTDKVDFNKILTKLREDSIAQLSADDGTDFVRMRNEAYKGQLAANEYAGYWVPGSWVFVYNGWAWRVIEDPYAVELIASP